MAPRRIAPIPFRNAYLFVCSRVASCSSQTDLMRRYGIDLIFDVGANAGQYARKLKKRGYRGRIVSFEPLPDAFAELDRNRWGFGDWQAAHYALGDEDAEATLHVAGNSQSSSLQPMHDNHVAAAPQSRYVRDCRVPVRRLDSVFGQFRRDNERCGLKIDVQGHEQQVLDGADGCLESIDLVELELSMVTLYDGQLLWQEMIDLMGSLGFELATITPGFSDPRTGVMLQADGVFVRQSEAARLRSVA